MTPDSDCPRGSFGVTGSSLGVGTPKDGSDKGQSWRDPITDYCVVCLGKCSTRGLDLASSTNRAGDTYSRVQSSGTISNYHTSISKGSRCLIHILIAHRSIDERADAAQTLVYVENIHSSEDFQHHGLKSDCC